MPSQAIFFPSILSPSPALHRSVRCVERVLDLRHPEFAAPIASSINHDARVALALFDHHFGERAEEPFDVRLQDECPAPLHDISLHPPKHSALRRAPVSRINAARRTFGSFD